MITLRKILNQNYTGEFISAVRFLTLLETAGAIIFSGRGRRECGQENTVPNH